MDLNKMISEKFSQPFPIILKDRIKGTYKKITWAAAMRAYAIYSGLFGTDQSLHRLSERGGFHEEEIDHLYPEWREHIIKP
jgi:hypothetical protein